MRLHHTRRQKTMRRAHNRQNTRRQHKQTQKQTQKQTHKQKYQKRTRGGTIGNRWMDTPLGPMSEEEYKRYQERLSPDAY